MEKPQKKRAVLITVAGSMITAKPASGKYFSYKELSGFVGGMVEIVPLPSGKVLVGNEESKLIGLPKNEKATELWKKEYPIEKYPMNNDELICGDVLICSNSFIE